MKFSKTLLTFIFFLFLINIAKAQYYAYPGECIQIQSNSPLICIPANASANETFNFTFQFTFEIPEKVEYRGFVKYKNITQNITIEKPVPYIPEEVNQTIENLNKSLEEKENLILNLTIESLSKNLEIKDLTNKMAVLSILFYLLIVSLLIYIFYLKLRIQKVKK
jgi:hypothetical protein